jgi:hypothetical protein
VCAAASDPFSGVGTLLRLVAMAMSYCLRGSVHPRQRRPQRRRDPRSWPATSGGLRYGGARAHGLHGGDTRERSLVTASARKQTRDEGRRQHDDEDEKREELG